MKFTPLGPGAEFDLIRRFLGSEADGEGGAPLPDRVRVGPGDDCAVIRGEGIAISMDLSLEGVHFLRDWLTPEEVGYRATAAALSDLAAMAATPIGVLVGLALRPEDVMELGPRLMAGARAAAAGSAAVLLGGDTTRSPGPMVLDVVVLGNTLRPVTRAGARPGDSLWVTGELGAAAAAVRSWKRGRVPDPAARLAFALPTPRTAEAEWLAGREVLHALLDLSDGLVGDAGHLAAASGVRMVLDVAAIPVHPAARASAADADEALRFALSGGEDYELCFAAPQGAVEPLLAPFRETFGIPLTRVGSVEAGRGVLLRREDGSVQDVAGGGFDHFRVDPA
jgi:thiamine-monophosphate kinase